MRVHEALNEEVQQTIWRNLVKVMLVLKIRV